MTPEQVLSLLRFFADLYSQISALQSENAQLRAQLEEATGDNDG